MIDEKYVLKPLEADGVRGYRLEIDEFLADNAMTNLFLIALRELQKNSLDPIPGTNEANWMNFYALAGIHGSPRENWAKVPNPNPVQNGNGEYGYCHHGKDTFPLWHRPYMMLYETMIHGEMVKQAGAFQTAEDRAIYNDAARRFRLPYWDVVMPRNEMKANDTKSVFGAPLILKQEEVFLRLPEKHPERTGEFTRLSNPLAYFEFPSRADYDKIRGNRDRKPLQQSKNFYSSRTTRVPSQASGNKTDIGNLDKAIQYQAVAAATMIGQMLNPDLREAPFDGRKDQIEYVNQKREWPSFANHRKNPVSIGGSKFANLSLESFHDSMHVMLGTGGTFMRGRAGGLGRVDADLIDKDSGLRDQDGDIIMMTGQLGSPAVAAFDPMFWLHHNNVERLLCIYQTLYPDKYIITKNTDTQLSPFCKNTKGEFYDCTDPIVKNYWASGFAVPGDTELPAAEVRNKVQEYLTRTYYWASNLQPHAEVDMKKILPGWPKTKNIASSWALHGDNAMKVEQPKLRLNALTMVDGATTFVTRTVALPVASRIANQDQQSLSALDSDVPIEESQVLDTIKATDSLLPDGALGDSVAADTPPVQVTWNAHVRVRKYAFDGPFSIHAFIGYVDNSRAQRFLTKKNEAGFTGVFANSLEEGEGCSNCQANREADVIVEDVIPLTTILYDYLTARPGSESLIRDANIKTITDLQPDNVVPFLRENLQWRMVDLGSNVLENQEQHAQLEITVTSRDYLPPYEGHIMGVYGPYVAHPEITNDKAGGFGYVYPTTA